MHTICHVEIPVADLDKAKEFYSALFGWKMEPYGSDYIMFQTEKEPGGGLQKPGPNTSQNIIFYVLVEEITAALEKAKGLGATIVQEKTEIPNMGWFGIFADMSGNAIGLFQGK
ncbi:hypothetical protein AMJ71_00620 [candidate division TA06 bacterium SM1_40]|uniref:VOC domain-containing protein n=1 Tax=candidate division TA06 bacterium SM1_40 TaxID=1703773 RepID=A0A0S8JP81_UNCT6|nr:MAG: hypothetical protein AMJ71_00620 [candidate division TA06 bacterium SM1_40]